MKISYEWLREYVAIKIRAQNLAQKLTMNGLEVTSMQARGKDFIFEIETTPNRADTLSHIGIAREVSAATKRKLKLPSPKLARYFSGNVHLPEVVIKDAANCLRYSARLITDVWVRPSPKWLIRKIEALGLRPVNNVVDITNFVLLETGHPLHAFDYDKLKGEKIIVRPAKTGEEITTIDREKRKLTSNILVIADEEKPIAIAGIMGGLDTEVSSSTKRVLLEAAYFDPLSIRRAARHLGLSTDSSYRFERGVDISGVIYASTRAASMICEIARAKTHKGITDIGRKKSPANTITLRPDRVSLILGTKISNQQIKSALTMLGFKTSEKDKLIKATPPSFRSEDIEREIDVIEEIARICGYDNIPTELPNVIITEEEAFFKEKMQVVNIIRNALTGLGFNEALTYSLVSETDIKSLDIPQINTISIENPLSDQQKIMRNSLLPGMLKAISYNINMQNKDLCLFELSNIYFKEAQQLKESPSLSLGACGSTSPGWKQHSQKIDIFYLKGALQELFNRLGISVHFEESHHPSFEPGRTMAILFGNAFLGIMGMVKQEALANVDIKQDVYTAEINVEALLKVARLKRPFEPIIKYPSSQRDISMCIDENISYDNIYKSIKDAATSIIKDIMLVEEYKGKQIPKHQRSLLISVSYQSKEKTLKEQEIETAHNSIIKTLTQNFNATIR